MSTISLRPVRLEPETLVPPIECQGRKKDGRLQSLSPREKESPSTSEIESSEGSVESKNQSIDECYETAKEDQYDSVVEGEEEATFLGSLPPEISATIIWRKLIVSVEEEGQWRLIQLLYALRGVCKAWRVWVEEQDEWETSRKFGVFNLGEQEDYSYACDSDGLPFDMYSDGYFDDKF
jgi:hypothetical protein